MSQGTDRKYNLLLPVWDWHTLRLAWAQYQKSSKLSHECTEHVNYYINTIKHNFDNCMKDSRMILTCLGASTTMSADMKRVASDFQAFCDVPERLPKEFSKLEESWVHYQKNAKPSNECVLAMSLFIGLFKGILPSCLTGGPDNWLFCSLNPSLEDWMKKVGSDIGTFCDKFTSENA